MSSREFAEWVAYNRLEPIGLDRFDFLAAMITWMTYNASRGKDSPVATISDFMPNWAGTAVRDEAKDLQDRVAATMAMLGAPISMTPTDG